MVLKPLVNSWDFIYNLPTIQLVSWSRISAINLMERSTSHGFESHMSYAQRWHDERMGGRTCRGPLPPEKSEAFFPDHDVPLSKVWVVFEGISMVRRSSFSPHLVWKIVTPTAPSLITKHQLVVFHISNSIKIVHLFSFSFQRTLAPLSHNLKNQD